MAEQLWRLAREGEEGTYYGLVPVRSGALLIEDGIEAALDRAWHELDFIARWGGQMGDDELRRWGLVTLRAAIGGQP